MWTMETTNGFTQAELDIINAAIQHFMADCPDDEDWRKSVGDAVNNVWCAGMTSEEIVAAAAPRLV